MIGHDDGLTTRERLVQFVHRLEALEEAKNEAADDLKAGFADAKFAGFDDKTLKAILKLRKMTPGQRKEKRALEAIYLAALGMLDGDDLPDDARERLSPPPPPPDHGHAESGDDAASPSTDDASAPAMAAGAAPQQAPLLPPKDPAEARAEGAAAAEAGQRIYDNPFRAGDPCRAAWDEGWCGQRKSNGMDTPEAYQRRSEKPAPKPEPTPPPAEDAGTSAASDGVSA